MGDMQNERNGFHVVMRNSLSKVMTPIQWSVAFPIMSLAKLLATIGLKRGALGLLLIAGRIGTLETKYRVGCQLEESVHFPIDPYQARQWLKKAADQGHIVAMLRLARLCLLQHPSFGVPGAMARKIHFEAPSFTAEPEMARQYALLAAETGNVEGLNLAGYLLATGQGGPVDIAGALKMYGSAVAAGHPEACVGLGTLFMTGKAGKIDFASARGCFRLASSSGNNSARYSLALMLLNGLGGPVEEAEAIGLFATAARKGHVSSMRQLAKWHLEEGRSENQRRAGIAWLKKLGNQGELSAILDLISRYRKGTDVAISLTEAAKWLQKAADLGDAQSQFELAQSHIDGDFPGASLSEAMELYRLAAESGHPLAQWHLDRLRISSSPKTHAPKKAFLEMGVNPGLDAFAAE